LVLSTFLGLTGGRARVYGLIGAYVDAGDKVDEVAGWENENGGHAGIDWAYQGVIDCDAGRQEA
jgi:hypothetical protein